MNEVADRVKRYSLWFKVGVAVALAAVVAPGIFLAIKGLIGLIVAAVLSSAVIAFAPVMSMKFANWRVKAIKAEAAENPIETLTNLIIAKRKAFDEFQLAVEAGVTARETFARKCEHFRKTYPARAPEFDRQLSAMTNIMEQKKKALVAAKSSIEEAEIKLGEMHAYYEMAKALADANSKTGLDTGDLYERMKAETAVDAVYASMNSAFASLEVAAALAPPDLGFVPQPIPSAQRVEVRS